MQFVAAANQFGAKGLQPRPTVAKWKCRNARSSGAKRLKF
jgi:hypothetical protein